MKIYSVTSFTALALLFIFSSCSTYKYAKQTKLIALTNDIKRGPSIGPLEGRDCRWSIFGFKMSNGPTLDHAIQDALARTELESLAPQVDTTEERPPLKVRYLNNIATVNEGYNLGFFEKQCLILSAVGHL